MTSIPWTRRLGRAALFAFVMAPVSGFFIGGVLGVVGVMVSGESILISFTVPMGVVIGLVFGSLVAWPFSALDYPTALKYLGGGSLALALPLSLVGEAGPGLSAIGGMTGFWAGAMLLAVDRHRGRVKRTDVIQG